MFVCGTIRPLDPSPPSMPLDAPPPCAQAASVPMPEPEPEPKPESKPKTEPKPEQVALHTAIEKLRKECGTEYHFETAVRREYVCTFGAAANRSSKRVLGQLLASARYTPAPRLRKSKFKANGARHMGDTMHHSASGSDVSLVCLPWLCVPVRRWCLRTSTSLSWQRTPPRASFMR